MDVKLLHDRVQELNEVLNEIKNMLNVDELHNQIVEIESMFSVEGFWDDHEKANKKTAELSALKHKYQLYQECADEFSELEIAIMLYSEGEDASLLTEIDSTINSLETKLKNLQNQLLLKGKFDVNDAVIDIHAGAGGTEAQDWVEMLYRMYTRYCNSKGYSLKVLHFNSGDMAGIKSISFEVTGINAYGMLKGEQGVHRLVRISPFDSNGKRHTSFASVSVTPVLNELAGIEIDKSELKIDTFRASGAGGQSVNTTDSAVRITHLPTGIVVSCQNERSQIHNKDYAMNLLKNKLVALREKEREDELRKESGEKHDIGWGAQIRSYVFQPYTMVKDHRTNFDVSNVKAVLDGEIEELIIKYLEYINS